MSQGGRCWSDFESSDVEADVDGLQVNQLVTVTWVKPRILDPVGRPRRKELNV